MNYSDWDKRSAFADMERLNRMMGGKVRVAGLVGGEPLTMPQISKKFGVHFLLLKEVGTHISEFMGRGRTVYVLSNALLLPNGKMTHIWSGYNRYTLRQMEIDLRRATGIKLSLDLSTFPTKLRVGSSGMYGLPGP